MAYNNLYDKLLCYIIHDVARLLVFNRKIDYILLRLIRASTLNAKLDNIKKWLSDFKYKDPWDMLSDTDDFAFIINKITVMQDGMLDIELLDEARITYKAPKYEPKKGIVT